MADNTNDKPDEERENEPAGVDPHALIGDIVTYLEANEVHPLDAIEIMAWCIGVAVGVAHDSGLPASKLPMLESDIHDRIRTAIAVHVDGYAAEKPKSGGSVFVPQDPHKIYVPN